MQTRPSIVVVLVAFEGRCSGGRVDRRAAFPAAYQVVGGGPQKW